MSGARFDLWRVACWLVLLLAAFAGVQYLQHGAWLYLGVALLTIVVGAGCILRQAWARPVLRVLALVLAAWALLSGGWMLAHLGGFAQARAHAAAQPQAALLLPLIAQARRTYLLAIVLKAVAVPPLLWLAWTLGRPAVRGQFRQPGTVPATR